MNHENLQAVLKLRDNCWALLDYLDCVAYLFNVEQWFSELKNMWEIVLTDPHDLVNAHGQELDQITKKLRVIEERCELQKRLLKTELPIKILCADDELVRHGQEAIKTGRITLRQRRLRNSV